MKIFYTETNAVKELAPVVKSLAQWRKLLTPEQFRVTRQAGCVLVEAASVCRIPL